MYKDGGSYESPSLYTWAMSSSVVQIVPQEDYCRYHMSFMLCELLFFSLQSTHLCNMKQNRYQNAAFGCFGLMPLYAPIFLPRRQ